jgi:UDP-N-acetylmuramate-alanine ligase
MSMAEQRFLHIRSQLDLYDRIDPDHLDHKPACEMFADCRRLLREVVNAADGNGAAPTTGNPADVAALAGTISKQAETIAAQADQIMSLSAQNQELTRKLLDR